MQVLHERLLRALVDLVDKCEESLVCFVAVAFLTLALLLGYPFFKLSFGKETFVRWRFSHLHDQSSSLVKVVSISNGEG